MHICGYLTRVGFTILVAQNGADYLRPAAVGVLLFGKTFSPSELTRRVDEAGTISLVAEAFS